MIRYKLLMFIALWATCRIAQAQTEVQYSAGPGQRTVVLSDGTTAVPDGNRVEIGYFDATGGFSPDSNSGNLSLLGAHWHQFGFTNIESFAPFGPPVPGRFRGDSQLDDPTFNGHQIYLWIFDTTGNAAPAADFSNVNEYGIFTSTLGNWAFPVDGTTPPGNLQLINSSEVDHFVFGSATSGSPGSLQLANVVLVPEPSSTALLGIGLVMARVFFRRKA